MTDRFEIEIRYEEDDSRLTPGLLDRNAYDV